MTWGRAMEYLEPTFDPAREWDAYCDAQERAYKALVEGKTCGGCGNCEKPDDTEWDNPERMGYCKDIGEFVCLDELVTDNECEGFE